MSVTFARSVARRLSRKRAGLDFIDRRRRSDERISGLQDTSLRRTVSIPERRVPNPQPWYRPTHGPAARVPALKNVKTARGYTIFNNYIVYHESELEHRVSLRVQTRSDVAELYSQAPVFQYKDEDGRLHKHTADFLVIYKDGFKQALIVKQERKREEMEKLIAWINAHESSRFVDDIKLRTERYGTIEAAENAELIRWSRERHDQDDVDELLTIVAGMPGWFRFGELLRNCSSMPRRRVAIWRLIDLGFLFTPTGEKVTELTWLAFTPAGGPTGLCG
ncbi:TnsA endonuclease N-terminal domain-containing protein [Rhizobium leguminosarum]